MGVGVLRFWPAGRALGWWWWSVVGVFLCSENGRLWKMLVEVVGAEMCSNSYVWTKVKIKRLVKKSLPQRRSAAAAVTFFDESARRNTPLEEDDDKRYTTILQKCGYCSKYSTRQTR
jgi:hypothetical protein